MEKNSLTFIVAKRVTRDVNDFFQCYNALENSLLGNFHLQMRDQAF